MQGYIVYNYYLPQELFAKCISFYLFYESICV